MLKVKLKILRYSNEGLLYNELLSIQWVAGETGEE